MHHPKTHPRPPHRYAVRDRRRARHHARAAALALLLAASGALALLPPSAFATGIPTFDYAAVMQLMNNAKDQAQQALDQLNQLKAQVAQAKSELEGNSHLFDVLHDPTIDSYLPQKDWRGMYSASRDLTRLRAMYGLTTTDSALQKQFDTMLTNLDVMQQSYAASVKRQQNIEQLGQMMNASNTPQQREDLENRLKFEQLELENEKVRLDTLARLTEMNDAAQSTSRANDLRKQLFGDK